MVRNGMIYFMNTSRACKKNIHTLYWSVIVTCGLWDVDNVWARHVRIRRVSTGCWRVRWLYNKHCSGGWLTDTDGREDVLIGPRKIISHIYSCNHLMNTMCPYNITYLTLIYYQSGNINHFGILYFTALYNIILLSSRIRYNIH